MPVLRPDRVYRGPESCGPGVVIIEDGVIAEVRSVAGSLPVDVPELGHVTVLPGLIDSLHLAFDASADALPPTTSAPNARATSSRSWCPATH
jgi:imidazolonepropionase-like amidohydrolase